jgi:arylformamidase
MDLFRRIYDISVPLDGRTTVYPGDPAMARETIMTLAAGDGCELSRLTLSSHAGTHLDAPAHFIADGKTIDRFGPETFIRPARVVCVPDRAEIRSADLSAADPKPGEALLVKTDHSIHRRGFGGAFDPDHVYLTAEAAAWCVARRLILVGIDTLSVDAHREQRFAAHRCLLEAGVLILESIDLEAVPEGLFTLLCLPLKIVAGEASPVRAVLLA